MVKGQDASTVAAASRDRSGTSLVEVIVAMGILVVIASGFVKLSLGSFGLNRHAWEDTAAANYAEEGLEASRSIARRNFGGLTLGNHGLSSATGTYVFAGTSNTSGLYTRVVAVAEVKRDGSDNIIPSGGTDDPDTRLVTSTVTWNPAQGPARTVQLTTYLTRWKLQRLVSDLVATFQGHYRNSTQVISADDGGIELLVATPIETLAPFLTRDVPGNQNVNEMAIDRIRDRLYIALQNETGTDPEFLSFDISNVSRSRLSQSGALDLGAGSNGFAVGKDYAYVLTDHNMQEVRVVRLRDFQIVATWDLPGNAVPLDTVLDETAKRLYVGRNGANGDEFYVLSTENPEGAVAIVNNASIHNNGNGIAIRGNFAYLATERNNGEIVIVNLSTMTIERCDLPGDEDAVAIRIVGDRLFIGRKGGPEAEFAEYAINPSDPGTCAGIATLVSSTQFGTDDVLAMSILPSEGYAIFAMNEEDKEIRLVNLSTFQEVGSRDLVGDKCDAVTFLGAYLYAGCRDNTATLQLIQGTAARARVGTVTSIPFDSGAEGTAWRRVRWTASGSGSVSLRLRTADTIENLKQAQWVGANGTTGTVYANAAGARIVTDPLSTGTRFIQWKASLSGNGTTPTLEDVTLTYP